MHKIVAKYADLITRYPSKRVETFSDTPDEIKLAVFMRLSNRIKYQILLAQPQEKTISLLESLDPIDATDTLQLFDKKQRNHLMGQLSENIHKNLDLLLSFDEHTAGGLMTLNYIQVDGSDKIVDVANKFRLHETRTGRGAEILVMKDGKLSGQLPIHSLGYANPNELITAYVKTIKTIHYKTPEKEVLDMFRSYPHDKLVVFDDNEHVLGVIYSDDVLRILKEQETHSLSDFAGIRHEEEVFDSAIMKVGYRYKWLLINLATAFLAAFTVGAFRDTLDKYILLAVYMPIVAGMGGNSATQTLAVMVRGIALRQVTLRNFLKPLGAELLSALTNGIINGLLVFGIVMWLNNDFMIGLILASAMIVNLLVAAFFGTIIPLIMKALGKDPATSATIFITTATDVLGFLAFLGLATILLD